MKAKRCLFVLIACVLVCALTLTACNLFTNPGDMLGGGGNGEIAKAVDTTEIDNTVSAIKNKAVFTESELNTSEDGATTVEPTSGVVEIKNSGTYIFEGEYGGIQVTKKDLTLHFIFKGATITTENGIAIDCQDKNVASLVITLADGTTNSVTNSGTVTNKKGEAETINAIHVKGGAVTVNGKGSLSITSESKSALKCNRAIKIVDATLTLSAANHAITGSAVIAKDCTINVTSAGKDGINAECADYSEQDNFVDDGYVYMTNVNYTSATEGDGIQADTVVYIDGGVYNITTKGKFVSKTADNMAAYGLTEDDFRYTRFSGRYVKVAGDETNRYSDLFALVQGCKGIKVGEIEYEDESGNTAVWSYGSYLIAIDGGTFNIDTTDDAIHANSGSLLINGGNYTISANDDAVTSDILTKITGGTFNIENCYEGIEGSFVEISGGTIKLVSTDDGINASSADKSVTPHIIISGGSVTVDASGDGLDSNGSILISGGTVVVHGPTTGRDAGLDADKGIVVTGGTLFATSTLGMVETPSKNSTQYVVSYAHQSKITAGSTVSVMDSKGNLVLSYEVSKTCQSIIFSCPALKKGATYTIYGGSTKMASFTVSSIITTVGSSGSSFPAGGRPGGGGPAGR